MPNASKEKGTTVGDFGPVTDHSAKLDGYTVNFVTFKADIDAGPLLKGCKDDLCQCPHWGYVLKGEVLYGIPGREEVYTAGDAFYIGAGHTSSAKADSEIVQFSPSKELAETEAVMMKNMQSMAGS